MKGGHNYGLCRKCSKIHVHPKGMLGKKHSPETIEKMRRSKLGSKNHMWKGDEAKERAIRTRLQKSMPVPKGSDRHHIDGNGKNSDPSNIRVQTRREHMIEDGRMEALRNKSLEHRKNISLSKMGSKNPMWKGDKASAAAKYMREYRRKKRIIPFEGVK